jgi:hypothetical protein
MNSTRIPRIAWAGSATVLVVVLLTWRVASDPDERSQVHVELSDRFPSSTAEDWVTYADFAAVVEMSRETKGEPDPTEVEHGEGDVPRTGVFTVKEVLWEADGGRRAPDSLEYSLLGWWLQDGDGKALAEEVSGDRPRLELGETYIISFAWQEERCYEGDGVVPAHWVGLGWGSELPYGDGQVGVGEFAGKQRDLREARAHADELPPESVSALTVGQPASAVAELLAQARPGPVEDYGPLPSDC